MNQVLSPKQREFWANCNHRWNVKTGATRSGKTYMDYYLLARRIKAVSGLEGDYAIIGNTRETVRRNVITPMQRIYGIKRISNVHSDWSVTMFGEKVYLFGADKKSHEDAIRGMSIKYCYGDEVTTWNETVFNMLKSRLDKPYSVFDGTCNPDTPSHWFKAFLDSNADIYQQAYQIDDNPFLPEDFVKNLKLEYEGTVFYDRYILGLWALAEGLIYPNYEKAITNDLPFELGTEKIGYEDITISIDYGTLNAFCAILWMKKNGIWYAVSEYYYSGRDSGIQKTDDEYCEEIGEWLNGVLGKDLKRYSKGYQKIETIIDPSAASFITLMRKSRWCKVRKADNAVLDGIRETSACMINGRIKVHSSLKNWKKEAQGYKWDESLNEDAPVKVDDHAMDATRYFVKTKRINKKQSPQYKEYEDEEEA